MQIDTTESVQYQEGDLVSRFRVYILALLLVLVCFAAHAMSLWNGFVLEDHFNVIALRDVAPKEWNQYWSELVTQAVIHPFAQPMLKASIAFDYQSGRLEPALYHASNIMWHVAVVLSAYFLLLRLARYFEKTRAAVPGTSLVPFVTCLIFACHPITSEAVAYISGRSCILTFFWYTLALHAFMTGFSLNSVRAGLFGYLFCVSSLVLSLFSSSQAITIPESMIVLGLLLKPQAERFKDWIEERSFEFGIALFMALATPLIFLLPGSMPTMTALGQPLLGPQAYVASVLKTLVTYFLRVFVIPVPLSFAPPYSLAQSMADPFALLGLAILLAAVYLLYRLRHDPFCCFGIWLFLIGLMPQAIVVSGDYASAERFYLSSFGLCLLVTRLFLTAAARSVSKTSTNPYQKLNFEPVVLIPVVVTSLVLIGLSNYRDRGYSTDSAVLRGALRANLGDSNLDKDAHLRSLLALLLVLDGGHDIDRGLIEAKKALDTNTNLPLAYLARGKEAIIRNDFDGAKYYAERVQKLGKEQKLSSQVKGLNDGVLLIASTKLEQFDHPDKLRELARSAIEADPGNSKLYLALARVYLSQHKTESGLLALHQLAHARRLDVNDPGLTAPIAEAHLATGNPKDFESAYQAASLLHRVAPTDGSRLILARAALETGRIHRGFSLIAELMQRNHNKLNAEGNMIAYGLYKQSGRPADADKYLKIARSQDPKIEEKIPIWLRVKPLTPIQQAREQALDEGHPIVEKLGGPEPEPSTKSPSANTKAASKESTPTKAPLESSPKAVPPQAPTAVSK